MQDRFKIIPAVYLVLTKNNKILLSRRFNTGYEDGKYSLPSGHLEGNETFREALKRESKEETNIDIEQENMSFVHVMHRKCPTEERLDLFIVPTKWQDKWPSQIRNMEPNRCDDLRWFEIDKLPENTIPYVMNAIDCIQKKITYSEFGW
jgi:8-oxo-dGTP diphosphatase